MLGTRSKGMITITLDANSEKLEAPRVYGNKRHYLPCSNCGDVLPVAWDVAAFVCKPCMKDYEETKMGGM